MMSVAVGSEALRFGPTVLDESPDVQVVPRFRVLHEDEHLLCRHTGIARFGLDSSCCSSQRIKLGTCGIAHGFSRWGSRIVLN